MLLTYVCIFMAFLSGLAGLHMALENRQLNAVLKWSDLRDVEFARLYIAAYKLSMIPKNNPLDGFKAHGFLAKDAYMRADTLLPMLDERLVVLDIALNSISCEAKALSTWEAAHPVPPSHYWQALALWRKNRGKKTAPPNTTSITSYPVIDPSAKQLGS